MTLMTPAEAAKFLAEYAQPERCDVCARRFGLNDPRRRLPYGPSHIHVCPACVERLREAAAAKVRG